MAGGAQLSEHLAGDSGYYFCGEKLLEQGNTPFQSYEVWTTAQYGNLLRLDGIIQLNERDEYLYHEAMVHIAGLAHEGPRSALVLGGGDGGTLEELLKYPTLNRAVMVEIDGKVIDIARQHFASVNRGAFDDPRTDLKIDDGMAYVRQNAQPNGEKFDLMILDLSDPVGPSAALYAEDFLRDCKAVLAPQGAFVMHLGPALFQPERVAELHQRLTRLFNHVTPYSVYIPFYGSQWSMAIASDTVTPSRLTEAEVDSRIAQRGIAELQYLNGATYRAGLALSPTMKKVFNPQP